MRGWDACFPVSCRVFCLKKDVVRERWMVELPGGKEGQEMVKAYEFLHAVPD